MRNYHNDFGHAHSFSVSNRGCPQSERFYQRRRSWTSWSCLIAVLGACVKGIYYGMSCECMYTFYMYTTLVVFDMLISSLPRCVVLKKHEYEWRWLAGLLFRTCQYIWLFLCHTHTSLIPHFCFLSLDQQCFCILQWDCPIETQSRTDVLQLLHTHKTSLVPTQHVV